MKKELKIFTIAVAFIGFAGGIDGILANYFKEAYNVTAFQRGFIEFPRELPGVLGAFVISGLGFMGDIRIAVIAQILMAAGMIILGLFTPSFGLMLVFLFIFSLGQHIYMPLHDGIAVSLSEKGKEGKTLGTLSGVKVASAMVASVVTFIGFRYGFFSFTNPVIPFLLVAVTSVLGALILIYLCRFVKVPHKDTLPGKIVLRKEYRYYYALAILNGVQKQIMIVFGPWVLVDLLGAKADAMSLLVILTSLLGMGFLPFIGRCMDTLGIRKILYADALSFIFVYALYGMLCSAIIAELVSLKTGMILGGTMFIFDRMSMNLGMVRTMYLKNISINKNELTQTISLGISMDHVVSIGCAMLSGYIWKSIGPQYVFYFTAALSVLNLFIAKTVEINE